MRRINYPTNITSFEDDFYFSIDRTNEHLINSFLLGIPLIPIPITFKDLVTAKFEELIDYNHLLQSYFKCKTQTEITDFNSCFNYSKNQPNIANFFMNKKNDLKLKTCFYCNIDFINSFDDFGEYENEIHFINKATIEELKIILGNDKAIKIHTELRVRNINNFDQLLSIKGIGKSTLRVIKSFSLSKLKKNKNHFTLDHFIPKKEYPYFALSLYNLIPSCYSCNSKFKGVMTFKKLDNLKYFSPSSSSFKLEHDLEFKLYFNTSRILLNTKIKNTKLLNDIRVDIENIGINDEFDTFLNMFKLKGRYVYHKNESLKLIDIRKGYSDSQIEEIAKITKRDVMDVKKDLFGSSIFNEDEKNEPFAKYKMDIAKQLGII